MGSGKGTYPNKCPRCKIGTVTWWWFSDHYDQGGGNKCEWCGETKFADEEVEFLEGVEEYTKTIKEKTYKITTLHDLILQHLGTRHHHMECDEECLIQQIRDWAFSDKALSQRIVEAVDTAFDENGYALDSTQADIIGYAIKQEIGEP